MKTDINLKSLPKNLGHFIGRYHVIIFVVTVLGGLAVAIFLLNNTLSVSAADDGYTSDTSAITFDNATIENLNELKTLDEQTELIFPAGRSNPFVE